MKNTLLAISVMASFQIFSQEKTYIVDLEVRNRAIELTNLAGKKIENKEFEQATALLVESIKTDSLLRQNFDMLYKSVISTNNNSDSILNIFVKSKKIFEEDDDICFYTGEIYRIKNDLKQAINEYSSAIKYSNSFPEKSFYYKYYFLQRATASLKLKDYEAAEKDFTVFLHSDSENTTALINRGICYMNMGKKAEAKNDWLKAKELGNEVAASYLLRIK